ncbi:MAG TPA: enoyl-CoA hydratase/isomerase family protein [Paracoccus sp.]|nr:enoyl-CoA hydratase/isomerase family protein [Paracoccus sp. (in: a-proteobacteria)]
MTTDALLTERRGPIFQITLNRPGKLNAINEEISLGLKAATEEFAADPALRVMVLRGAGRYFSAGADINSELFPDPALSGQSAFREWYGHSRASLHPLGDRLESLAKPVVAAHNGPVFGGALELSLSCDFRLASTSASYALPEIALGGLPGSGGISRLTRIVGPHWARWLVMAGERIGAEQALSIGLAHAVWAEAEFDAQVEAFCQRLATQPPEAMAAGKLAIEAATDLGLAQARNIERLTVGSLVMGQEYAEKLAEIRAKLARKG